MSEFPLSFQSIQENIYFIRHNFAEAETMQAHCKENHFVGIHFNNEAHHRYEDYSPTSKQNPGFKKAFEMLINLGKAGGLVMAQFESSCFYLGRVDRNTSIQFYNRESNNDKEENNYKLLFVADWRGPFFYARYPVLSALRPPFQTITRLSFIGHNLVRHLFFGDPLELVYTNLHPQLLEQMVEEFLRSTLCQQEFRIRYGLLKTGKTLPVVDIYALTVRGHHLCVQVTHGTDEKKIKMKAVALKKYALDFEENKKVLGLFVAPKTCQNIVKNIGLEFLDVQLIFDTLKNDATYADMIKAMIGII